MKDIAFNFNSVFSSRYYCEAIIVRPEFAIIVRSEVAKISMFTVNELN